jgi:outer membrane murein-binding lipoprotein Lpp
MKKTLSRKMIIKRFVLVVVAFPIAGLLTIFISILCCCVLSGCRDKNKIDDPVVRLVIDSLQADVRKLKLEQEGYDRNAKALRDEVNGLKADRIVTDSKIAEYEIQLRTIKTQYAKIPNSYRNISADSTRSLFTGAFDY